MNSKQLIIPLLSLLVTAAYAAPATTNSPDGQITLKLAEGEDGRLSYSLSRGGRELIKPSPLGYTGHKLQKVTRISHSGEWRPLWGKRTVVPDIYNEITLDMGEYKIQARAYDDGVAFRYRLPEGFDGKNELTHFNFADDYTAWFYNGEGPNIGPEKLSASNGGRAPVMTIDAGGGIFLALHESDLGDGDPLSLHSDQNDTSFRVKSKPSQAWRTILIGSSPGDLIDSHLIELLNPDPDPKLDFSWVKPGISVWDWRINGAVVDDFHYTMSLPSWKKMVDFASEQGFAHLMLDADWYGPEFGKESDPLKGGKADQVKEIIRYGKEKNVGIWLYLNDVAGRHYPIEKTLKQYGEWGAAGVKYGFMTGNPEQKNIRTRQITEMCAKNKLLCDFHDGPVHPYGQMRTWPNAVTREFCQAQLDARKQMQPGTFMTSVFVNMVAGPLDMNNGLSDLTQKGRKDNGSPVPSTVVGEAARTLIVFSGSTIIPDIPEAYYRHPEVLEFIAAEKMPWRESRTLSGKIGEHIVMARQAADGAWLVGAATNEEARELTVPLNFLGDGEFNALVLQDGKDSDYRTQVESYTKAEKVVTSKDRIQLKLAPGGGGAILLRPATSRQ